MCRLACGWILRTFHHMRVRVVVQSSQSPPTTSFSGRKKMLDLDSRYRLICCRCSWGTKSRYDNPTTPYSRSCVHTLSCEAHRLRKSASEASTRLMVIDGRDPSPTFRGSFCRSSSALEGGAGPSRMKATLSGKSPTTRFPQSFSMPSV